MKHEIEKTYSRSGGLLRSNSLFIGIMLTLAVIAR